MPKKKDQGGAQMDSKVQAEAAPGSQAEASTAGKVDEE